MHKPTFNFTAAALELALATIIGYILADVQYVHKDTVHFLTSSTMKLFAS